VDVAESNALGTMIGVCWYVKGYLYVTKS
jgi:hypothetical protein